MTSSLAYVSARGERVELDGGLSYVGTALGIRGRQWSYTLRRRGIAAQSRDAREATLTVDYLDLAEADRLREACDRDVAEGTPGTLSSDGWEQRCYVVKSEPQSRSGSWMQASLTVLLLDGAWHRLATREYLPGSLASDYGKAYSYGYPYDYAPPSPARSLEVSSAAPCPFRLVVYGRAVSPAITVGGNLYQFDVTVPAGGYLLVDTLTDPVVELVTADGQRSDAFSSAHRGGGAGSGDYCFEPLAPGYQTVAWNDSFGFSLGVYEERSELPWAQS